MLSFIILLVLFFFAYYINRVINTTLPGYSHNDLKIMEESLESRGCPGFKFVYSYFNTAVAFNKTENKMFIKGFLESAQEKDHYKCKLSSIGKGFYEPNEVGGIMLKSASQSYTVSGIRPLLFGGIRDILDNFLSKRQAKYDMVKQSGIFVRTKDGKIYQIIFKDEQLMSQISWKIDEFRNGDMFPQQNGINSNLETDLNNK